MPEISVIMLCYNFEKYIEAAIVGVLNQTFKNLELIVIDDGSTDGSLAIIKKFMATDNRIKLIKHKKNYGPTRGVNEGIEKAEGKYIVFSSGDDISYPGRLEVLFFFAETLKKKDGVDYIFHHSADKINEQGLLIANDYLNYYGDCPERSGIIINALTEGDFVFGAIFAHIDVLRNITPLNNRIIYTDYAMLLKLASKYKFMYVPVPLVYYRIHEGSMSNLTPRQRGKNHLNDRKIILKEIKELTKTQRDNLSIVIV